MKTITPHQLHDRLQQGETLHLLDVRTPAEHAEIHIPAVQLDRLDTAQFASVSGFAAIYPPAPHRFLEPSCLGLPHAKTGTLTPSGAGAFSFVRVAAAGIR